MRILFKNKWRVFFIALILILLAVAGVFLWQKYRNPEVGYVLSEEFTITESGGEKIIEYKEGGFKMRIPGDWEINGFIGRNGLLFTSPDFEFHERVGQYSPPIPGKGCSINISIAKRGTFGTSHIGGLLDACQSIGQECNEYIVVEFNGIRGLERTYVPENSLIPGKYVSVDIRKGDRFYLFETHLFSQDRERCEQEFENILNTIEIRKYLIF